MRDVKTVTRTVTISDLTPAEMASIFAGWFDTDQAAFFDALAAETADWPGCGWGGQAYELCTKLGEPGTRMVADLSDAYISWTSSA